MKRCPECGGSKFERAENIRELVAVDANEDYLYTIGTEDTTGDPDTVYYCAKGCEVHWLNWEDIPDTE